MNTGKFLTIPADEYHAASRSGQYMSSHLLADFRESPELYRRKTSGEIAEAEGPTGTTVRTPDSAVGWCVIPYPLDADGEVQEISFLGGLPHGYRRRRIRKAA